ncbi:MAG: tRNA pseudouridine(38-40) synthase TruA [Planctomycetota bacterium]
MPTYLLTIAFDGTRYAGWQRQADVPTVQQGVEEAVARVFGGRFHVEGSSRTDAGVHALGFAAHVRLPRAMDETVLAAALNGNLPQDITVRRVRRVPDGFHARFQASGKRYVYRMIVGRERPPIARNYFHWVRKPVDLEAMREACRMLVGRHDFASFATNPGYERRHGTIRTIRHLHLIRRPRGIDLCIQGDGFLYNMVRAIAGTLIAVGTGNRPASWVAEILAARDRRAAGATAPARGLYLVSVLYSKDVLVGVPSPPPAPPAGT